MVEDERGIIVRSGQTSTEQASTTERNFTHWKSVVGLSDSFPKLSPIENSPDKFHAGNVHKAVIREILQTGSPLRVAVVRGQGCTTLSRYVYNDLDKHSFQNRTIPIFMQDWEMYGGLDRIRYGIVHFLATQPVWMAVGKHEYASGLGGNDGRQCEELQKYLNGVIERMRSTRGHDQDWIISRDQAKILPRLEDPLSNPIFRKLEKDFRLQFIFDFSPVHTGDKNEYDPTEGRSWLQCVNNSIYTKKHFEEFKKTNPRLRIEEVYFSDPYTLEKIFPSDQRVGWDIKYPPYSPSDVFAILAKQYRPEAGHLATVIEPQLLERLVKPDRPLVQIIDEFGRDLKQRMQTFDSIPYRIHS